MEVALGLDKRMGQGGSQHKQGQGAPGLWGGSCEQCHEKQKCNGRTRVCMVRDEAKVGSENLEVVIGRWR